MYIYIYRDTDINIYIYYRYNTLITYTLPLSRAFLSTAPVAR